MLSDGDSIQHKPTFRQGPAWENDGPVEFVYPRGDVETVANGNDEKMELAAEAMKRLIAYCWNGNGRYRRRSLTIPFRRFVVLSAVLDPMLVGNQNFTQLAGKLQITKAAFSRQAMQLSDIFGIHFRVTRRSEARDNMRAARMRQVQGGKVVGRR